MSFHAAAFTLLILALPSLAQAQEISTSGMFSFSVPAFDSMRDGHTPVTASASDLTRSLSETLPSWPTARADASDAPSHFSAQQPNENDPVFRSTLATKISMGAFDLYYTGRCLEAGTCHEGNPGLRWAEDSWMLPALKMIVEAGTVWILLRVRDKEKSWYRDAAFWTAAGLTAAQGWLVKRNYDLYQDGRRR